MPLNLDVVCDSLLPQHLRHVRTVRVIGEILPFVLTKYGVGTQPDRLVLPRPSDQRWKSK